MKKKVDLPLLEPLYSTYQFEGPATAILANNPSIRNWYLSHAVTLACSSAFLHGRTTPDVTAVGSSWTDKPFLETVQYSMQFLKGHVHYVIHNLLDQGYYVCFSDIDDYYVEGKSFYHERHFSHDGCICGYDRTDQTYCIYSYDKTWVYRKFWTSQKSFEKGRRAQFDKGIFGCIWGIKPKNDPIAFYPHAALEKICGYVNSTMEMYPDVSDDMIYGTVVHDYISKYIDKLYEGSIPYERMDWRVFRVIWEHKKVMLERIERIEAELSLDHSVSDAYRAVVREADNCRMLYAAHHMKQRNTSLPIIQKKLMSLKAQEKELLETLLKATPGGGQK